MAISDQDVGVLVRDRAGAIRFTPEPAWIDGGQKPVLGLGFLRNESARIAGTGLPFWFESLLPEKEGYLRRRVCADHGLRESDSAGDPQLFDVVLASARTAQDLWAGRMDSAPVAMRDALAEHWRRVPILRGTAGD